MMINNETARKVADLHFEAGQALEKILIIGLTDLQATNPEKAARLFQGLENDDFVITSELFFTEERRANLHFFMMTPDGKRTPLFNFCPATLSLVH